MNEGIKFMALLVLVLAYSPSARAVILDCSDVACLEAAINAANVNTVKNIINLTPGSYNLTANLPSIAGSVEIVGAGPGRTIIVGRIDGSSGASEIFQVTEPGDLTVSGVKMTRPSHKVIINNGTVNIQNSIVSESGFLTGSGDSGIFNNGTMTIFNSRVSRNGGDEDVTVGGIFNGPEGNLTIINSTIRGNNSEAEGAIENDGTMTIVNSTVAFNSGEFGCGGLENAGTMTVTNSTIHSNSGGFAAGGVCNFGTMSLTHVTVSKNTGSEESDDGDEITGGAYNSGTLKIRNSIISGNRVSDLFDEGEGAQDSIGSGVNNIGILEVKNTIVSNNLVNEYEDGEFIGTSNVNNCFNSGSVTNAGNNISNDPSCGFGASEDADPKLDTRGLRQNGGATNTVAILEGSAAINSINFAECTDGDGNRVTQDQRGVKRPRPIGGRCDMGAFEAGGSVPTCGGLKVTIFGTSGGDSILGTNGENVIHGMNGHDLLNGLRGNDVICAGFGVDSIKGGSGNDDSCNGGPSASDSAVGCEMVINVP